MILTAIPNVSAPDIPCEVGATAIHEDAGWKCYADVAACPASTTLYVGHVVDFEWRFCTPDVPYAEALYGPNQTVVAVQPVPTLDAMGFAVLVALLGFFGLRRLR